MSTLMLYPAIDLLGGKAVRLTKGERATAKVYSDSPQLLARGFREAGAAIIHVVDLDAAFDGPQARQVEVIARILDQAQGVPVTLGGGLRDLATIDEVLAAGISRVLLGTAAVENRSMLREALKKHGSERIAVAVDERDGLVKVRGWAEGGDGVRATDLARELAGDGVRIFLHSAISRDGTLSGPDVDALRRICEVVAPFGGMVVCAGGIGTLEHLRALREACIPGLGGVVAGRALYERAFSVAEALRVLAES